MGSAQLAKDDDETFMATNDEFGTLIFVSDELNQERQFRRKCEPNETKELPINVKVVPVRISGPTSLGLVHTL